MNWVQFRSDQAPINLDHVIRFKKTQEEYSFFCIRFFTVAGDRFHWSYRREALCNEDYQALIQIVLHSEEDD